MNRAEGRAHDSPHNFPSSEAFLDWLRQNDFAGGEAARKSILDKQAKLTHKLLGIDRQEAARVNETPDELVERHAKRGRNTDLKYARRELTGKLRKADASRSSAAGCLLVRIQDLWASKGKPPGGVAIPVNKLSSWLETAGWGASKSSVRDAIARCSKCSVLSVRKSGRQPRRYLPTVPRFYIEEPQDVFLTDSSTDSL